MAPKRVLLVHSSSDLYGSDLACLRVAIGARAEGWYVEVLVPTPGPLVDEFECAGVPVHIGDPLVLRRADLRGVRAPLTPFRWASAVVGLRRFSRRHRFDVVHSNCGPTLGGLLLARWWRVPHVWFLHELFWQEGLRRFFERVVATADAVVVNSQATADQFPSLASRCRVAPPGVTVPPLPERPPLEATTVQVVCVGRLNDSKGQDVLLRACSQLRRRGVDVIARLVGDVYKDEHHHRERLQRLVHELNLEPFVVFDGERRDALDIVATSDIAVTPSTRPEGFGMALVEAMLLGRPVVATAAGGPLEIVRDGVDGILVPPGDPAALADAIERLVTDRPGARLLAERGRMRAQGFDPSGMVRVVLEAYDHVVGARLPAASEVARCA